MWYAWKRDRVVKQEISWSEICHRILRGRFAPGHKFVATILKYMVCHYSQIGLLELLWSENYILIHVAEFLFSSS